MIKFAWYLDLTPNRMFSLDDYPIPGKDGVPLCEQHGRQLEMKEVVLYDEVATEKSPPGLCSNPMAAYNDKELRAKLVELRNKFGAIGDECTKDAPTRSPEAVVGATHP